MQRPRLFLEQKARSKGYRLIAGIDEAGRGPLAGPVVAACVILDDARFSSRINDSKLLTPLERQRSFREIISKCRYGIGIVGEDMIDIVNIYQATKIAMQRAVSALCEAPDFLLIDGVVKLDIPHERAYVIKGDRKSVSIACASIIAKVTRDRIMEQYDKVFPQYCFGRHKGYGTKAHICALKKYGPCSIHRKSFKPVSLLQGPDAYSLT